MDAIQKQIQNASISIWHCFSTDWPILDLRRQSLSVTILEIWILCCTVVREILFLVKRSCSQIQKKRWAKQQIRRSLLFSSTTEAAFLVSHEQRLFSHCQIQVLHLHHQTSHQHQKNSRISLLPWSLFKNSMVQSSWTESRKLLHENWRTLFYQLTKRLMQRRLQEMTLKLLSSTLENG